MDSLNLIAKNNLMLLSFRRLQFFRKGKFWAWFIHGGVEGFEVDGYIGFPRRRCASQSAMLSVDIFSEDCRVSCLGRIRLYAA